MASPNTLDLDGKLMELISMGFEPEHCLDALEKASGNLEHAANLLLTAGGSNGDDSLATTQRATTNGSFYQQGTSPRQAGHGNRTWLDPYRNGNSRTTSSGAVVASSLSDTFLKMVHGSLSQYSIENGRSACTCIALKAAEEILKQVTASKDNRNNVNLETAIDLIFLQNIIIQGVEIYSNLKILDPSMEHTSAEEVLMTGCFPALNRQGIVQQGMLTHNSNSNDPMGLYNLLQSSQGDLEWTCVLITKPPETVLVVLPPRQEQGRASPPPVSQSFNYVLVDSHPRPQQFGAQEAYARMHTNLRSLVRNSLEQIFPCTNLGPDIPPLMAAMYNQFDLYQFRANKNLMNQYQARTLDDGKIHVQNEQHHKTNRNHMPQIQTMGGRESIPAAPLEIMAPLENLEPAAIGVVDGIPKPEVVQRTPGAIRSKHAEGPQRQSSGCDMSRPEQEQSKLSEARIRSLPYGNDGSPKKRMPAGSLKREGGTAEIQNHSDRTEKCIKSELNPPPCRLEAPRSEDHKANDEERVANDSRFSLRSEGYSTGVVGVHLDRHGDSEVEVVLRDYEEMLVEEAPLEVKELNAKVNAGGLSDNWEMVDATSSGCAPTSVSGPVAGYQSDEDDVSL